MPKKVICLMLTVLSIYLSDETLLAQKVYLAPQLYPSETVTLDGVLNESFWNSAPTLSGSFWYSPNIFKFYVPRNITELGAIEGYFNPGHWSDTTQCVTQDDINVTWRAVWRDSTIYLGIDIPDDILNGDNYSKDNPKYLNIEQDDGIHLFFDNQKNAPNYFWQWKTSGAADVDSNYIIHNTCQDSYFVQLNAAPQYGFCKKLPTNNFKFAYSKNPAQKKWSIEAAIKYGSPFSFNEFVWYEIIYNEADDLIQNDRIIREYRLAWNTWGAGAQPWNSLGKIKLVQRSEGQYYEVMETPSKIKLDGKYQESAYSNALNLVLPNARIESDSSQFHCFHWNNYQNAFVTFRALSNFKKRTLHLVFKVFDDYKNSLSAITPTTVKNEDAVIVLIDFNNDSTYSPDKDVSVLITNKGKIYKYANSGENYSTVPFQGSSIKAKTGKFGLDSTNWIAEVAIKLPKYVKKGKTIGVALGYNDADKSGLQENQLVWSGISSSITPWNNFKNLGKFVLTGKRHPKIKS